MPVACHAAPDHHAVEHVERGKQRGRAVALVVMRMVPARPGFSGSPGWVRSSAWTCDFSSSERTMAWRGGSHTGRPRLRASRRRPVVHSSKRVPDAAPGPPPARSRAPWQAKCRSSRPSRSPSSGRLAARRLVQGPADHLGHLGRAQRRDPRRPGPIAQQPVDAGLKVALLPPPDRRFAQAGPTHDLRGADPRRRQEHHLSPPNVLLRLFRSATIAASRARSATPTNKPRFPRIRAP